MTQNLDHPSPTDDRVVVTALARPDRRDTSTPAVRGPIEVPRTMLARLLGDPAAPLPGPVEPSALLVPLRASVGRARGRSSADLVALLRLVLVADAHGMVLHCA